MPVTSWLDARLRVLGELMADGINGRIINGDETTIYYTFTVLIHGGSINYIVDKRTGEVGKHF